MLKNPLPFGSGFFAKEIERREVEKEAFQERPRLTASATFLAVKIPEAFKRRVKELKTNSDFFVNRFLHQQTKALGFSMLHPIQKGSPATNFLYFSR